MKASVFCSVLLGLLLLASLEVAGQFHRTYPHKPEASDSHEATPPAAPSTNPKVRINPAQLQQEMRELSSLAQDLTQDMDAVNRGLLPSDTVNKLKQVEKLAKRMRREIAP